MFLLTSSLCLYYFLLLVVLKIALYIFTLQFSKTIAFTVSHGLTTLAVPFVLLTLCFAFLPQTPQDIDIIIDLSILLFAKLLRTKRSYARRQH